MTQSRIDSVMEVTVNIAIGLVISTAANAIVLPAVLGVRMNASQNITIAGIFTAISLVRSYVIRRAFNGRSPWMWLRSRRVERPSCFGDHGVWGDGCNACRHQFHCYTRSVL